MTERDEKDGLIERIRSLERKLVRLEKESRVGTEDQIFFGLVVAVTFFVASLSLGELSIFFQDTLGLSSGSAVQASLTVKNVLIAFLFSSTILRYYAAVRSHDAARLLSFLCFVLALDFLVLMLVATVARGVSLEVFPHRLPFSLVVLGFVYLVLGEFVERRMVGFYAGESLVLKRYVTFAVVSLVFAFISFSLYLMLLTEAISAAVFNLVLSRLQIRVTFLLFFGVFVFLYVLWRKRRKVVRFWKRK